MNDAAAARRYLAEGEEIVIALRRHPAVLLAPLAVAILAMLTAAVVGFVVSPDEGNDLVDTVFGLVALGALLAFGWKFAHWWVERIYITPTRVFEVSGLLTRRVATMPLRRVTDMTYSRTIAARILGYGNLRVESAGQHQGLTELDYLPKPDQVYRSLTSLIALQDAPSDAARTVFRGARIDDEDTGPLPRISL